MKALMRASFRAQLPRLRGTATAIVLAVAFLSAALDLSFGMYTAMRDNLTTSMARADVRVEFDADAVVVDTGVMRAYRDLVQQVDGVTAVDLEQQVYPQLSTGGQRTPGVLTVLLDPTVRWQQLSSGTWPDRDDEVVIGESTADALGLSIGDSVGVTGSGSPVALTVVGVWSTGSTGFATSTPTLIATAGAVARTGADVVTSALLVVGDGTGADALVDRIDAVLPDDAPVVVLTRDEATTRAVASLTGGVAVLGLIVVGFVAVTLFAAGLVITHTFAMVVARRTQELALLRCVGASRAQVRWLILGEAALTGLCASVVGAVLGWAATIGLSALGGSWGLATAPTATALVVGVLAVAMGTALTVVAAAGPARRANRVAPLAALRPVDARPVSRRRRVVGAVAAVGVGLSLLGVRNGAGLPLALLAGVLAYLTVAAGSAEVFRSITRVAGVLWRRGAPSARIGVLNLDRNAQRTAASALTVVVGVALVVLMSVGIGSVRGSLLAQIDAERPVDLVVESSAPTGIDDSLQTRVAAVPGVSAVAAVLAGTATVPELGDVPLTVRATDPEAMVRVARDGRTPPGVDDVWISPTDSGPVVDGGPVTLSGDLGSRELTARITDATPAGVLTVDPAVLDQLVDTPVVGLLQLRVGEDPDSAQAQQLVATILGLSADLTVYGGIQDRVYYTSILNRMLAVVLALLAVTILVAVVGIANTTSISVLERRSEYAMLRAAGMTRAQLIRMVCTEAGAIAGVGASIGAVLGVTLAWAGLRGLSASATKLVLTLQVPYGQVVVVLVVALLCGLLASIGPALAASRRTIVQDMALAS
jgi:putative ABC transport system permease protein